MPTRALLDLWRNQTGVDVRYEIHISDPTSVNRLRAGETTVWDFINVNNPWARNVMYPAGLIVPLPRDRFDPVYAQMKAKFAAALQVGDERRRDRDPRRRAALRDLRLRGEPRRDLARSWPRTRAGTSSTTPTSRAATASSPTRTGTSWTSAWAQASIRSRSRPTTRSRSSRRRRTAGSRTRRSSRPTSCS